jgi:hypothetical protein
MSSNDAFHTPAAKAERLDSERGTAARLLLVFLLGALIRWFLVGKVTYGYYAQGALGGPINFSGWFVVAFAFAILFTTLVAVGLWIVLALDMYKRYAVLPES